MTYVFANVERLNCERSGDVRYISTALDRSATSFFYVIGMKVVNLAQIF